MAKTRLMAGDSEGFLRAYADEARDLEHEYSVVITARIDLTSRRGVLAFVWTAWSEEERRGGRPAGQYSAEYPRSEVGTLEAFLYQSMVKLGVVLRDARMWPQGKA